MTSTLPPQSALPIDKELVLKVIPMPADCNANGDIFGGWVMAQVDLAGSVLPARHVQGRMATVAVNEFVFKQPVRVGDILSFFSTITRIGRTSVTVEVEVYAERFAAQGRYVKVTEARLTYVAIDASGRPRPVPRCRGGGRTCRPRGTCRDRSPLTREGRQSRGPCPAAAPLAGGGVLPPPARDCREKDQAASGWDSLRETFAAAWFWGRTEVTVPASISPASWPPSSITTLP